MRRVPRCAFSVPDDGDILKLDCGVHVDGYVADLSGNPIAGAAVKNVGRAAAEKTVVAATAAQRIRRHTKPIAR